MVPRARPPAPALAVGLSRMAAPVWQLPPPSLAAGSRGFGSQLFLCDMLALYAVEHWALGWVGRNGGMGWVAMPWLPR